MKKKRKSIDPTPAALQQELATRFPWLLQCASPSKETTSTGSAALDALTSGLPRGSLVEICGERCSGRTSIMVKMLAAAIARGEVCALVDASGTFDPQSGEDAGLDLARLLWVRCERLEQAFRSAEWLLAGGGFGIVALDLSDVLPTKLQHVPLNVWFRLRRAVERTPTVVLALEQRPFAGPCASLVMQVKVQSSGWSGTPMLAQSACCPESAARPAHTNLFSEKCISPEVVRSRAIRTSGQFESLREGQSSVRCCLRLRCDRV